MFLFLLILKRCGYFIVVFVTLFSVFTRSMEFKCYLCRKFINYLILKTIILCLKDNLKVYMP